jgi:hypothetical protein
MGLAYNLDVKYWDDVSTYLSDAFRRSARADGGFPFFGRRGEWAGVWSQTGAVFCQGIFPTGEYIIRDAKFINGMFVFCGSYKAFFKDLYGTGNDGYAWDGFIMVLRGYSNENDEGVPFRYDRATRAFQGFGNEDAFGILPMRMPMDIQPSAIGDAVATAADDSVGLQAIDIYKFAESPFVGAGFLDEANIKTMAVGFQLVGDPVAQGMQFSTIDYVGFMFYGTLLKVGNGIGGITIDDKRQISSPVYLGDPVSSPTYSPEELANIQGGSYMVYQSAASDNFKVSWRATANNTLPTTGLGTDILMLRDLDEWLGVAINQKDVGLDWNPSYWEQGSYPNGDNPSPVVPFDPLLNSRASDWDYFPRRFMDITTFSATDRNIAAGNSYDGCFMIVGDCSVGLDIVGTAVETVPMCIGGFYPFEFIERLLLDPSRTFPPSEPIGWLGPYMVAHIAGISAQAKTTIPPPGVGSAENLWTFPATMAPVSTFPNSYAAFGLIPYEYMGVPQDPFLALSTAIIYIGVNGVEDADGGTNSAIFMVAGAGLSVIDPVIEVPCLALSGSVVSEAQTVMPTKWIGKATQTRTFTVSEEEGAKGLLDNVGLAQDETFTIQNSNNNGELVGWKGNYQRYGLDGDTLTQIEQSITPKAQGNLTRQGYGFLGYKTGAGPTLVMFDSGGGLYTTPTTSPATTPSNYSNAMLNEGDDLNRNTLPVTDPINTTRMALTCQWDNDRDQWLFCEQDPILGTSIISVNSGFSGSSNNNGYLDQTPNFSGAPPNFRIADCHSSLFVPFLMTNNLDGIVLTGGDDPTSSGTGTQFDNTDLTKFGCYSINNGAPSAVTNAPFGTCPTVTSNVQPTILPFYKISGSTGRTAKVWVDYVLFDGADALIATKLRERGMKVTIEAVEWFKRKIINKGDLNISQEEIEVWMRDQQDEFKQMMQDAERQGRVRKRKSQVSAYGLDMSQVITPDYEDKEVQEFMKDYLPTSRPPTPEEQRLEKQRKGGYSPEQNSYFDEVFED